MGNISWSRAGTLGGTIMTFWRKRLDHAGADKINAGLDIITLEKEEGEKGLMIWVPRPGFCSWQENAAMQALRDISGSSGIFGVI